MRTIKLLLMLLASLLLYSSVYAETHPTDTDDLDPLKNTIWQFTSDSGSREREGFSACWMLPARPSRGSGENRSS